MTDKIQGTCSVCIRVMQLRGDHPIRHGFHAIGVRHGQQTGHHTGPCAGVDFPHLGISTAGTQWALSRERDFLARTEEGLATLATNPDLTWYPEKLVGRMRVPDISKGVKIKYGDTAPPWYSSNTPPSYEALHRREKAILDNKKHAAENAIATYEKVLATWSPAKYPTTGAPAKAETVHMERTITTSSGVKLTGTYCKAPRRMRFSVMKKTTDPAQVTCKRCRSALGLPPL